MADEFREMRMFGSEAFTVPEAAYVTGHSVRSVNHEIDGRVIDALDDPLCRRIGRVDLLYLGAVRNLRTDLAPSLRRRLRAAIGEATESGRSAATVEHLTVSLDAIEDAMGANLGTLQRLRAMEIESRPEVLAGEPVLSGTRISARHVADMLRHGASRSEIADELDITPAQIAAAELFDRVSPRQGRPPRTAPVGDVLPAR